MLLCMTDAEYLLDRTVRLRDSARRARHPEDKRYLVCRAAEAALLAEMLESTAVATSDEAKVDATGRPKAC
jgi:hypothetical protein